MHMTTMDTNKEILSADTAAKKIERMAYEIVENNTEEKELWIGGIRDNGLTIAKKIKSFLDKIFKGTVYVFEITIDKKKPQHISMNQQIDFNNKVIIITDDVANSGKTMLYALKPFLEFYPKKIQTLALVERSYKEFPIAPDFVGLSVSTASNEKIIVETENGEVKNAWLASAEDLLKIQSNDL